MPDIKPEELARLMRPDPKPEELRMWCAVRCDQAMPVPKMLVQCAHACLTSAIITLRQDPARFWHWFENSQAKIVVRVNTLADLQRVKVECETVNIPCALVIDEGRTVFNGVPAITYLGIGPCYRSELPNFVRRLRLLEEKDTNSG